MIGFVVDNSDKLLAGTAWLHLKGKFQKVMCLVSAFANMQ
jgi:hypothetical protein